MHLIITYLFLYHPSLTSFCHGILKKFTYIYYAYIYIYIYIYIGGCWTFSAVAAMEGIAKLQTSKSISLSEQELVDCDIFGSNIVCEGGCMDDAFKFIIQNRGLNSEARYLYKGVEGHCNKKKESSRAARINDYENMPEFSEKALLKVVAHQPISVAIDAGGSAFQFYEIGIIT